MSESTPKPRRRWTSISLRGLMLLVLLIGGPMAWQARKASLQQRAVARVKTIGGAVVYDWEYGGNAYIRKPGGSVPGPIWLRKLVGDDYFQTVVQVNIPESLQSPFYLFDGSDSLKDRTEEKKAFHEKQVKPIEDDQLACLDGFDRLESLMILQSFAWKPEGVARLGGLTRLKELQMIDTFDSAVLERIGSLANLEILSIPLDMEQEIDLAFLQKLPRLRMLGIHGLFALKDAHLTPIGHLRSLKSLTLTGDRLTDEGLAQLKDLKSLEYLAITGCPKATGEGLTFLDGMTNLETLFLSDLKMNHAGLDHIRKLTKLKTLSFEKGQLDDKTLDEFKAERPGVSVTLSPTFNFSR